jgi:hypothetical protein
VLADPPATAPHGQVTCSGLRSDPELHYAAADVVLVDAMGFTGCELAFNRGRVIALTDERELWSQIDSSRTGERQCTGPACPRTSTWTP